jgi:hypothetical protein
MCVSRGPANIVVKLMPLNGVPHKWCVADKGSAAVVHPAGLAYLITRHPTPHMFPCTHSAQGSTVTMTSESEPLRAYLCCSSLLVEQSQVDVLAARNTNAALPAAGGVGGNTPVGAGTPGEALWVRDACGGQC